MTFFLLWIGLVGAVSLSIRYDVSEPVKCHVDDDDLPTSGSLQPGRRPLDSFHFGGWRPWRRCPTSSCTPGKRHLSSAGKSSVLDGNPLSAVQASHVGLIYNLARRMQHTRGGGDWDSWRETSPFGQQVQDNQIGTMAPPPAGLERKMKMTQVLDQGDDGEFIVQGEDARAAWYQQYLATVGGWPPEEEDPTLEQLSALQRRLTTQDTAPYVDFAIYVPYGHRALKASKFRTYVLTSTGYTTKELPGPATFSQWRTCFRLLRTSLIMLDAVGLAAWHGYEMAIERLSRTYPAAWHLIYAADEVARSAQSNRLRSKIMMDIRAGKGHPEGFNQNRPWDYVYNMLAKDETFWRTQVHTPALAWIASGSHGVPKTPAEQLATNALQGGISAIAPVMENDSGTKASPGPSNRRKKRKWGKGGGEDGEDSRPTKGQGGKKGGSKGSAGQKCFAWNNGNAPCGDLAPGQQCAAKVKRLHRCTKCDSPGHPSRSCTKKEWSPTQQGTTRKPTTPWNQKRPRRWRAPPPTPTPMKPKTRNQAVTKAMKIPRKRHHSKPTRWRSTSRSGSSSLSITTLGWKTH